MVKYSIASFIFLFILGCGKNEKITPGKKILPSLYESNIDGRIFKYATNNDDPSKIGQVELDGNLIAITSFCINGDFVYLTDEVHKNFKKINLINGELIFSKKITNKTDFKQFNDICVLQNKIYVTSIGKTVYFSDLEFSASGSFNLPTKGLDPVFVKSNTDSIIEFFVEFVDSIYVINENNKVLKSYFPNKNEKNSWQPKFDVELGRLKDKKFEFIKTGGSEYFKINGTTIKLKKKFEYCYDLINLDFNEKYLVIFEQKEQNFILFVYDLMNYPGSSLHK